MRSKFKSIKRIGIAFHYIDSEVFFLDIEKLFTTEDLDTNASIYSNNLQFIIDIINEFKITNIDYLACNTLQNDNYKKYYNILTDKTNVLVGASNDKTGNINYGGDWVLESTQEDVQNIYFTNEIVNYANLLATTTYTFNNINYQYDPSGITIPSGIATVATSNSASGAIIILSTFTVNSVTYTVTSIGTNAFLSNSSINSISIPSSVTSIGASAFQNCTSLSTITLPNSLTSLGNRVFRSCTVLNNVTIPNSLTTIPTDTFYGCTSLSTITLPTNLITLGSDVFNGCTSLNNVILPNTLTSTGTSVFINCTSLSTITIPNSLTALNNNTFTGCTSLSTITLPTTLISIGNFCFNGCTSLNNVILPNSLTSLNSSDIFYGCTSLSTITLPTNLTSLGNGFCYLCTSLSTITLPDSITSIGSGAFGRTSLSTITLPTTLTTLNSFTFEQCTSLSTITLPNSLISIGSSCFRVCTSLSTITLPNSLTSIGGSCFRDCTSLSTIALPNSLTTLNNSDIFNGCTFLSTIILPTNLTSLGSYIFSGCTSLSTITLPNSLTIISGGFTFNGCTSLSTITLPNSLTSINSSTFYGCSSLTSIILTGGSNTSFSTNNNDGILYNSTQSTLRFYPPGKPQTDLSLIPNTVTSYATYSFATNKNLTTINIPSNVTTISSDAFNGCTSLRTLFIPKTVTSIGTNAFTGIPSNSNPTPLNAATLYTGPFDFTNTVYTYFKATFTGSTQINYIEYPAPMVCFLENSKILTKQGYRPIQDLRKGDLIKTIQNGYVPIDMIGYREIYNPICEERIQDKLYVCTNKEYSEIFEDLIITGCHSILIDKFKNDDEKEKTYIVLGANYVTDGKYRLPACVDERAKPYEKEGNHTIYHLALEHDDYYMNYGIYANGLVVETCSKRYLKELSNMTLINL